MNILYNEQKDLINIIRFFIRNRKIYIWSFIATAVITITATSFMDKKYTAGGIIFPTATNSLEDTYNNPMFGYDVEADRLIQLLQSKEIQDSIVKKYNLITYFELDTNENNWIDDLNKKYAKNIFFSRTSFMSINITAQMKDPQLAVDVVNSILNLIDPIRNRILKQNIGIAFHSLQTEYLYQKSLVDTLVRQIHDMRNDYGNPQISLLTNLQLTFKEPQSKNTTFLEEKIDKYIIQKIIFNEVKAKYEKARAQYERPLPSVYVINRAIKSNKKIFPSYSFNLAVAIFSMLILVTLILTIKEKMLEIKQELNNQ